MPPGGYDALRQQGVHDIIHGAKHIIESEALGRAQPRLPELGRVGPRGEVGLLQPVVGNEVILLALERIAIAVVDPVIERLQADAGFPWHGLEIIFPAMQEVEAKLLAMVELMGLIAKTGSRAGEEAGNGIGELIGEVVIEICVVVNEEGFDARPIVLVGFAPARRDAVARGVAAVGRIFRAPARHQPQRNVGIGNLVGGEIMVRIGHARDGDAIILRALAPARDAVDFALFVGPRPRAVIAVPLKRGEQFAGAQRP